MIYKGFIFDFDGLIIDTETPEFIAWQEIYAEHGYEFPADLWQLTIGSNQDAFDPVQYLINLSNTELSQEIKQHHKTVFFSKLEGSTPLPGVVDLLKYAELRQIKCAIASSATRNWIDLHLKRTNLLSYFLSICTQEDVSRVKPFPDLYQLATSRLNLNHSEVIAFEDSPNGVSSAKSAGIACIAVPNSTTRNLPFPNPDKIIQSLQDYVELLL
jgi:HAD superfamily hydrolase (TIGR01509 family)